MAATGRALAATDEASRIAALLELEGVGVPTASTLLYFAFPDDYPILDVRALESLGVKPRSQYPVSFWLEYLGACREIASGAAGEHPDARQGALAVLQGAQPSLITLLRDGVVLMAPVADRQTILSGNPFCGCRRPSGRIQTLLIACTVNRLRPK